MQEARKLSGGDVFTRDDLVQEGLMAALSALNRYDSARGSEAGFVRVCARNKMISYLRQNVREAPMEEDVLIESLDANAFGERNGPGDQQEILEIREALACLVDDLSPFEQRVLSAYLKDGSISGVAQTLGLDRKKVDNALQRIRNKARSVM